MKNEVPLLNKGFKDDADKTDEKIKGWCQQIKLFKMEKELDEVDPENKV